VRIALVGFGYWGPTLARVLTQAGATLAFICDTASDRLALAARAYPYAECTTDPAQVIRSAVDAVVLATPPTPDRTLLAARALEAGKHVWIEKPMATSALDALVLTRSAAKARRALFVDHTFVYHPAVQRAREIVQSGRLGDVRLFDSTRVNLGLLQDGVPVWHDLAPHDLSIFEYVMGRQVEAVQAVAACHAPAIQASTAYVTLVAGPLLGHLSLSWNSPVKVRRTVVGGSDATLVYDDLDRDGPIKVYDRGVMLGEDNRVAYREGDTWIPRVATREALAGAAEAFKGACAGAPCPTDGEAGLRVVRVLDAIGRSVGRNGSVERV